MRNRIVQLFLLAVLVVGVSSAARASGASAYQLNIPFDFTVNGKLMKAGNYSISFGVSSSKSSVFLLRSSTGTGATIVNPIATLEVSQRPDFISAVFEKSEDGYTLAEVYSPRSSVAVSKKRNNQNSFQVISVKLGE